MLFCLGYTRFFYIFYNLGLLLEVILYELIFMQFKKDLYFYNYFIFKQDIQNVEWSMTYIIDVTFNFSWLETWDSCKTLSLLFVKQFCLKLWEINHCLQVEKRMTLHQNRQSLLLKCYSVDYVATTAAKTGNVKMVHCILHYQNKDMWFECQWNKYPPKFKLR